MHLRSLYRSPLFWLGIPPLIFLIWAWWVSTRVYFSTGFSGTNSYGVSSTEGELVASWNAQGGWPDRANFYMDYYELSEEERREWMMGKAATSAADPTFRYVVVPYYAVVLPYGAAWLLVLAGRQRRKSRLLKLRPAQ